MAKKGTKIALTYFITIIVTLVVIGGVGALLLKYILDPPEKEKLPDADTEQLLFGNEYTPSFENNKTSLFIFDSEKRMSGCCFMVVRMAATERKLMFMPLPADTYANVNGEENSLYEFYRTGGTAAAVKAAEAATGVKMDYYLKLDNDSFTVLVDIFGGVDYNVPYNLIYSNPDTGEETVFREGESYLDSNSLRKLITYPLFNSGEEYRAKIMGVTVTDLVNRNIQSGFSTHIDDYFSTIINSSVETNFTAYDYQEQSEAMKYIADSSDKVAQLVTVIGAYDDNSHFVLDENFVKSLTEWLKLYDESGAPIE